MDDELREYLETAAAHKAATGLTPDDARRAVLVETGSLAAVKDRIRRLMTRLGSRRRAELAARNDRDLQRRRCAVPPRARRRDRRRLTAQDIRQA